MSDTTSTIFQQCHPQLASTLYAYEKDNRPPSETGHLKTGIKQLDKDIKLRAGGVIGIGGAGELHDHALTLLHALATTHLLTPHSPNPSSTSPLLSQRLFLIEPPSHSSLLQIHTSLSHHPSLDTLTSRISLLRPLSLLGILQSLSEIASSLEPGTHIVVIRGLGPSILAAQQGGSGTKSAALVAGVARAIRGLVSRAGARVTVLVECNVGGEQGGSVGVRVRSAFSSALGRKMRLVLEDHGRQEGGGVGRVMRERMPLVRMVEDVLDTLVVVHDGFGVTKDAMEREGAASRTEKCIVEVVKDELGGALGSWAVWDVKREDG